MEMTTFVRLLNTNKKRTPNLCIVYIINSIYICLIDSSQTGQNGNHCFYFVMFKQFLGTFVFTIIVLLYMTLTFWPFKTEPIILENVSWFVIDLFPGLTPVDQQICYLFISNIHRFASFTCWPTNKSQHAFIYWTN